MHPAPVPAVSFQHIDPQFGPLVSESGVGGKRYWTALGSVLFLGVFALVGFVAALAEGLIVGALILGLLIFGLVLALGVLSGLRISVYTHGIERRGRFGSKRLGWDQL